MRLLSPYRIFHHSTTGLKKKQFCYMFRVSVDEEREKRQYRMMTPHEEKSCLFSVRIASIRQMPRKSSNYMTITSRMEEIVIQTLVSYHHGSEYLNYNLRIAFFTQSPREINRSIAYNRIKERVGVYFVHSLFTVYDSIDLY